MWTLGFDDYGVRGVGLQSGHYFSKIGDQRGEFGDCFLQGGIGGMVGCGAVSLYPDDGNVAITVYIQNKSARIVAWQVKTGETTGEEICIYCGEIISFATD